MAIGKSGARNAGILAAQILGASDEQLLERIRDYKEKLKEKVEAGAAEVRRKYNG